MSTLSAGEALVGASDLSEALLQGAGWPIDLAVAERLIRRPAIRSRGGRVVVA